MNRIMCAVVAAFCVLFSGCPVRSLSPLFTEKGIVFDPTLLGTYKSIESSETFTFQRWGSNKYTMIETEDDGDTSVYRAELGKLGTSWFLDLYRGDKSDNYSEVSTHLISRLRRTQDTLNIALLEEDWLEEMVKSGKLTIPHWRGQNDMILTASTEELQKLVIQYADDEKAFPRTSTSVRVR